MRERILLTLATVMFMLGAEAHSAKFAENHMDIGQSLFKLEQYSSAIVELEKAHEVMPVKDIEGRIEVEYMLAICAAKTNSPAADEKLEAFLDKYLTSIYANEIHYARGVVKYNRKQYTEAEKEFQRVNDYALPTADQDGYNFHYGHVLFMKDEDDKAYNYFVKVDKTGKYAVHAKYLISYIHYSKANYSAAKQGFNELANDSSYGPVVPFYLYQIEFLQGNYNYVVKQADALAAKTVAPRDAEVIRLAAEAWLHLGEHYNALTYIDRYETMGGAMSRQEYYIKGYSGYMLKKYDVAVVALTNATGPDDKLTQNASYHLADAYLKTGDKHQAMRSFGIAAAGSYNTAIEEDAMFNYAKLQYELNEGMFNETINILNRYINKYPNSLRADSAREYLLAAYYNSRNFEAAYDAIKQIKNPDNNIKMALQKITYFKALDLYTKGEVESAEETFKEATLYSYNPKYNALTAFWQGEIAYQKKAYSEAIPLFKRYLALAPASETEYATAHYNLGYCYFNTQKWGEAATWLDKYLKLYKPVDSHRADGFNRLGDAQYAERSYWKAIESYDAAMQIGTEDKYYAEYQRALMLGLVDRPERKIESLNTIIQLAQGGYVGQAMYELGRTFINQDRFSEGALLMKRFISEYPESPKTLNARADLGLIYQNLGQTGEAINYYKQVVESAPHSQQGRDAMNALRSLYVDINDVDGYVAYVNSVGGETSVTIVERDSLTFASAEKIYVSGDVRKSEEALNSYLANFPKGAYRADALYYAADCAMRRNQKTTAEHYLKELTNMSFTKYYEKGLDQLASLTYNSNRFSDASAYYLKLSKAATSAPVVRNALRYYLRSEIMLYEIQNADNNSDGVLKACKEINQSPFSDVALKREADYAMATTLRKSGQEELSLTIYERLSSDVTNVEGAEAAFRVVAELYHNGQYDTAQKKVFAIAEQNSTHDYWIARSFLVLGDVYLAQGDTFQARATYQSVLDGYPNGDDGVVEEARIKIENL